MRGRQGRQMGKQTLLDINTVTETAWWWMDPDRNEEKQACFHNNSLNSTYSFAHVHTCACHVLRHSASARSTSCFFSISVWRFSIIRRSHLSRSELAWEGWREQPQTDNEIRRGGALLESKTLADRRVFECDWRWGNEASRWAIVVKNTFRRHLNYTHRHPSWNRSKLWGNVKVFFKFK